MTRDIDRAFFTKAIQLEMKNSKPKRLNEQMKES
jgi:hypothetical protein